MVGCIASERCLRVVGQLNQLNQWNLLHRDIQSYVDHLITINPTIPQLSEERLCAVISNYHADHRLVAALSDHDDPRHVEQWESWSKHIVCLIASRLRTYDGGDVALITSDDLAQEVMTDLWQALPHFRYESRLQTWMFTIVANRIARSFRSATTQKRRPTLVPHSLDHAFFCGISKHPLDTSMEDVIMADSLEILLRRILAEHPDARLQVIFHLWLHEDQPLRVIGSQLNLSVPRVHVLLNYALALLRSERRIQHWVTLVDEAV